MLTNWQSVGLCQYLWPWVLKSYTDIILQSSMVPTYRLLFNLQFWFSSYLLCECHWLCHLCNCNLIFKRKNLYIKSLYDWHCYLYLLTFWCSLAPYFHYYGCLLQRLPAAILTMYLVSYLILMNLYLVP